MAQLAQYSDGPQRVSTRSGVSAMIFPHVPVFPRSQVDLLGDNLPSWVSYSDLAFDVRFHNSYRLYSV
jgi:hypothetical protein